MDVIRLLITVSIFVCLFWTCIFLLGYRKNPAEKRVMFWFMLSVAVLFFGHYCYSNQLIGFIPITDTLFTFTNLAIFPLYYYYIRKVATGKGPGSGYFLMIPAVVLTMAKGISYLFASDNDIQAFINCYLFSDCQSLNAIGHIRLGIHRISALCFGCLVIYTMVFGMKHIRMYEAETNSYYSNNEGKESWPIRNLLICLVVMSAISMIMCILGPSIYSKYPYLLSVILLMVIGLLTSIGYDAFKRKFSYTMMRNELADETIDIEADILKINGIEEKEMERNRLIAERIEEVMHEEKLYLQPDLKLTDLATAVNTNRNYIYEALSIVMHTSFSDYVNKARIEYAQHLMEEDESLLMSDIARSSGYTSESSFYRNFKKITGLSPGDYLASKRHKD